MTRPWKTAAENVQLKAWKQALVDAAGNISHAAKALDISRAHATRLMKKYVLVEFAAKLRVDAGMLPASSGERRGIVAGRPRSRSSRN